MHNPPVLLLDEPTSAMDPESARLVRDSIKELRSDERTIVICTHNLAEAEELADRIAIIRQGRIIANGSPLMLKERLLGPQVFELKFSEAFNSLNPTLPDSVEILGFGEDWVRFRTDRPGITNPVVLRNMMEQNFQVVSLQEVQRSLEQVYLQAVAAKGGQEIGYVE
jgi:ABC-2 type transport system ATP-binding protein